MGRDFRNRIVFIVLAGMALANSGCLVAAAGAAAGGATALAYYDGKMSRTYAANFGDVWSATHTALAELGMPIESEEQKGGSGTIHARTLERDKAKIELDFEAGRTPTEGPATRVSIRVATFGDSFVSHRFLDQVGFHLAPPGVAPQTLAPPLVSGAPQQTPMSPLVSGAPQQFHPAPPPGQTPPPPMASSPVVPPAGLPAQPVPAGNP